jgi:hypothetical protein
MQCEVPVEPSTTDINGIWYMTWQYQGEDLKSEIEILNREAVIRAFGNQESSLLSAYEEATFDVEISKPFLRLVNQDTGIVLSYLIVYQDNDSMVLSYLNEIEVHLSRNTN